MGRTMEVHACCSQTMESSFADWIFEPGFVVMNRGMLMGLQQKAEGAPSARSLAEQVSFACVGCRGPKLGSDAHLQEEVATDAHRRVGGGLPHNFGVLGVLPVGGVRGSARLGRPRGAALDVLATAKPLGSWAESCLR